MVSDFPYLKELLLKERIPSLWGCWSVNVYSRWTVVYDIHVNVMYKYQTSILCKTKHFILFLEKKCAVDHFSFEFNNWYHVIGKNM